MGELIRRETPKAPKEFDGERFTAAAFGQVEVEHYHRYLLARHYCRGLDVLDIAAGEGYGSALLSQVARSVVGVEIDAEVVRAAAEEFVRPNLRYECGDARRIPLEDASVDVVVSFETLEHIVEHDEFLAEMKRVLRPNGFIILSTPDSQVYSPMGSAPNPYHLLELTSGEFNALLGKHFLNFEVFTQRAFMGSVILSGGKEAGVISFENRNHAIIEANESMAHAPYLIAFASDAALPRTANSVFVHRNDLDTDFRVRIEAEMARNATQVALNAAEAARIQAEAVTAATQARLDRTFASWKARARIRIEMTERRMLKAEHEERVARQQANEAQSALAETRRHYEHEVARLTADVLRLHAIEYSMTWRATRPLRSFGHRFPGIATLFRRVVKLVWWTLTLQLGKRYKQRKASAASGVPTAASPPAAALPTHAGAVSTARDILDKIGQLKFAAPADPEVSILIATYGHLRVTVECLESIIRSQPRASFEVIIADDGYQGPEEMGLLGKIEGVRFIVNAENLGYLRTCNEMAKHARGKYIYLLNNDTELKAEAIDALAEFLARHEDAGIVGSKLVYPDGRLQEAGGIVWNDASAWNYGHGQHPERPQFNYVRQVDYCSGASLMMPRELFNSLGGLDPVFAPAYYEDCDLCFRVRAKGLNVYYQPKSVVVHKEGVSHGVDVNAGVKRYQLVNQGVLRDRWAAALAAHYPNGEHVLRARDRSWDRKVILIIEHYVLEPDRDAGSRSVMGIVDVLLAAGWVVKFWPVNRVYSPVYTVALEQKGVEVLDHRWAGDLRAWLFENGQELDHVLVSRPNFALDRLEDLLPHNRAVLSFYGVDLHANRMRRQAKLEDDLIMESEADQMERLEISAWPHFDVALYPSEEEAELVREMAPNVVVRSILPFYSDDYPAREAPAKGRSILFVAGFAHPPNVDAAVFLVNYVIPLVRLRVPDVTVTLAGSNPTDTVRELASESVTVTGYISNEALSELYNTHRASVVPLRFGAGVKGKVVESLSHGLPLVTTPIGVEGIPGLRDIVPVHDDPQGIAEALETLLLDDAAWLEQSKRQQAFAQRFFSFKAMQESVLAGLAVGEAAKRDRQVKGDDRLELM
jgi:GT2 family glycosyltransferase/SAM-dependent methyltransferase